MEERVALFREFETGVFSVTELCERYGISRQTFYAWHRRRASGDEHWFEDRSRAPKTCPHRIGEAECQAIIAMRKRFPHFGPKKVRAKLMADQPKVSWPQASTIGDILKRAGLVATKRRRRRAVAQGEIVAGASEPNGEWAIDFKGHFRTRDGLRCDPLTLTDTASRYLVDVRIIDPTFAGVQALLERVFREVGLPEALRSDNGPPFGSSGAGGLSRLSVWLMKLGIEVRHIPPASPQDNARHERMHRTLKDETVLPPAVDRIEQQLRFNRFRLHYNNERPHEALGQVPPATMWQAPSRQMPARLIEPWYDADHEVRKVRTRGEIKWRGGLIFISEALAGEPVGITEIDDGLHLVRFCQRDLGTIDPGGRFHRFAPPRARLRRIVQKEEQR